MATLATNGVFPYIIPPLTNISPFTYRDGATYLEILEGLRNYINNNLRGEFNDEMGRILDDFNAGLAGWAASFAAYHADLSGQVALLNDTGVKALIDNPAGLTGAALRALIDTIATTPAEVAAQITAALTPAVATLNAGIAAAVTASEAGTATALAGKVPTTALGAASGVATLTAGGKITPAQLTPPALTGSYAARPAPATVNTGTVYYTTDTKETYRTDGTVWALVGKGGFLGSASLVTLFETASTDLVDVPGLAVTFIAGAGNVKVTLSGQAEQTVTNGMIALVAQVNGADGPHVTLQFPAATAETTFTRVAELVDLTPGEVYTVKVKMLVSYVTGGYGRLKGTAYNPISLIIEGE